MTPKRHSLKGALSANRRQGGMALYVAMIMLLLVSLIGISAMQVSNLQYRMAVNYNDFSLAFQRAEGALRESEFLLQRQFDQSQNPVVKYCADNANAWGEVVIPTNGPGVSVRRLTGGSNCGVSPSGGDPTAEDDGSNSPRFQLLAAAADRDPAGSPSAVVVVETVFTVLPAAIPPPPPPGP